MTKSRRRRKSGPSYSTNDVVPMGGRVPKALSQLFHDDGNPKRPVFSFALMDHVTEGDWGWHLLDGSAAHDLVTWFGTISRNTWNEIRGMTGPGGQQQHRLHHDQTVSSLCDDAQAILSRPRYEELGGDIFRFRLSGVERLWGFVIDGIFYAVWWDPNHRVYPTEPD